MLSLRDEIHSPGLTLGNVETAERFDFVPGLLLILRF
jgi:hypothetical protein